MGLFLGVICWWTHRPAPISPERLAQLPPAQAQLLMGSGDFVQLLVPAQALLRGSDPFVRLYPGYVPYPLTAAAVALPFVGLPPAVGGGLVMGISVALLTYFLLAGGQRWRLLLFCSVPYASALSSLQLVPLIIALALAGCAPLALLIKPQNALPLMLTCRSHRWAVGLAVLGLAISLLVMPRWPLEWVPLLSSYEGVAPILVCCGPLLLLALLCWERPGARLLILLACCPQRDWYDPLALWLIPQTRRGMVILTLASWLALPLTLIHYVFPEVEWANWHPVIRLVGCYFPALGVLLWEQRATVSPRARSIVRALARPMRRR